MKRKIPQVTFAEHPDQGRKCWISLSGCNFDCKACISTAKQGIGKELSVDELVELILIACKFIWGNGKIVNRVVLTGGEPILNKDYLLSLINRLKENGIVNFELSTNCYLLDENLLNDLCLLNVDILFKPDLKAYDDDIHKQYTGKSNANILKAIELLSKYTRKLHKYGPSFIVRTVLMPGIVDIDQIEKIAKFISEVDKNACYRIQQFSPVHGQNLTRRPTFEEMLAAYNVAKKYLDNVIVSTYLPTRPEYNYVEVRADELTDLFAEINQKSKSVIASWDVKSYTMNQILNFRK
ncbi:MAG: radical SAM protein [Nitrospirota bacterium]